MTPAQLDQLPVGSRVTDAVGDVWEKQESGLWRFTLPRHGISEAGDEVDLWAEHLLHVWGPVEVLPEYPEAYLSLARSMGVAAESMHEFAAAIDRLGKSAKELDNGPRAELLFRLNARARGEDPGQTVNHGPDGWRV